MSLKYPVTNIDGMLIVDYPDTTVDDMMNALASKGIPHDSSLPIKDLGDKLKQMVEENTVEKMKTLRKQVDRINKFLVNAIEFDNLMLCVDVKKESHHDNDHYTLMSGYSGDMSLTSIRIMDILDRGLSKNPPSLTQSDLIEINQIHREYQYLSKNHKK